MSKKENSAEETASQSKAASAQKAQTVEKEGGIASRIAAFREYLILSRKELQKVSWPSWKETRTTSLVVLGFIAVMAILLGLADLLLSSLIRLILS